METGDSEIRVAHLTLPIRRIVDAIADSVLVVSETGTIVFANTPARELLGRPQLEGTEFGFPLASRAATEIELFSRDRSPRCAEMRVVPLPVASSDREFLLVTLRDVTERRRAESAIKRLNESLQERVRELESFTYSVSHDLQAPLRSIRSYAEIVIAESSELSGESRHFLERINANIARMSQLVQDMLRLSHSSLAPLQLALVDLGALAREVARQAQVDDATGARFVVGDLPAVRCDEGLLRQVFENLFGNAIKYRKAGEPPIVVVSGQEIDGMLRVEVRDNGIGFPPEAAKRIFSLFERLHSSEQIAGTGVGLSLVQKIVERHGGRVWAEAAPGLGAAFYFTIPIDPALFEME